MSKKQKQEILEEIEKQSERALKEANNIGKEEETVQGKVISEMHANINGDRIIDDEENQDVEISKVTNEDIQRLK